MQLDAIVLDLDDTLYDTTRLLLPWADRRAIAALRGAGLEIDEDCAMARLRELRLSGVWSFAPLVERHVRRDEFVRIAESAWFAYHPPPMTLETRVERALDDLAELAPLALLTSGDPATQRGKVDRLGIAERFAVLVLVPREAAGAKPAALAELLAARAWRPERVIVCGDRPDADIRAAHRNGCRGVLVRSAGAEFAAVKATTPDDVPWRTIEHVAELAPILRTS